MMVREDSETSGEDTTNFPGMASPSTWWAKLGAYDRLILKRVCRNSISYHGVKDIYYKV